MQANDRPQFEEQLMTLCAGFNVPCTQHRRQAYFFGLQKMSLAQFGRVVEHALSENGVEDLPTVSVIWTIHKDFRKRAAPPPEQQAPRIEDKDHLLFFANRLFFRHMLERGGFGSEGVFVAGYASPVGPPAQELFEARRALRDTVDWYVGIAGEGDPDATPAAFVNALIASVNAFSTLSGRMKDMWRRSVEELQPGMPIVEHMVRPLPQQYERPS